MNVKPATQGAVIRDPQTKRPLPAEGGQVPETSFWMRRLRAGDVVLVGELPPPELAPIAPLATRETP